LLRTIHNARRRLGDQRKAHLTADLEYILLCQAILIGATSGRPKNATEISRFIDIPRATAQRKLDNLEKHGIVARKGSKYHLIGAQLTAASAGLDEYVDKCLLLIKRAAKSL
jgi:DNA-binding IclR family transcriptional regulator